MVAPLLYVRDYNSGANLHFFFEMAKKNVRKVQKATQLGYPHKYPHKYPNKLNTKKQHVKTLSTLDISQEILVSGKK